MSCLFSLHNFWVCASSPSLQSLVKVKNVHNKHLHTAYANMHGCSVWSPLTNEPSTAITYAGTVVLAVHIMHFHSAVRVVPST